jgi:hypothetical protein
MQKLFICLAMIFFTYCLPDELNSLQTPTFSLDILSYQPQSFTSFSSCDEYKHRNAVFYPPANFHHYPAEQLEQYFRDNHYSEQQILEQELLYLSDEFVKVAKTCSGYNQAIEDLHKKFEKFGAGKKILHLFTGGYASGLKLQIKRLYQEIQCKKKYQEQQKEKLFAEYKDLEIVYRHYCPLLAHAVEKRIEAQCYSPSKLQQVVELESIEIINEVKLLPLCSILYPHQEALVDCATAVGDYSKEGFLDKAMCVADFCWSLLDYGQAIAEGVALGVYSAAHDVLTNPIEATVSIIAGKQILAFQLCKVLYHVADIGVTAISDSEKVQEKWNKYAEPLNNIIDAISKKEITLRDAIKGGTAFIVGYKAQGKLLGGLGKFCNTIKRKSIHFIKNNQLSSPQEYLGTPEGLLFKATAQSNKYRQLAQVNSAQSLKNAVERLGETVWKKIKLTDQIYPGTKIPKSFELSVGKERVWVAPNATKHMLEYIQDTNGTHKKIITHTMPINCQILLLSFRSAVKQAIYQGIKYDTMIRIGCWEFRFGMPRGEGLLPSIYHANFKPKNW